MKTEYFQGLLGPERSLSYVRISPRERAQLAHTAIILERLRTLRGWDNDDEMTIDVAMAAHVCRELADSIQPIPNP